MKLTSKDPKIDHLLKMIKRYARKEISLKNREFKVYIFQSW